MHYITIWSIIKTICMEKDVIPPSDRSLEMSIQTFAMKMPKVLSPRGPVYYLNVASSSYMVQKLMDHTIFLNGCDV